MTDVPAMRRFFSYLIYANGVITVGLSLLILGHLWLPDIFPERDIMWKVIISYGVVLMNFAIFMGMDRKLTEAPPK